MKIEDPDQLTDEMTRVKKGEDGDKVKRVKTQFTSHLVGDNHVDFGLFFL